MSSPTHDLFLGIDCSTTACKAIAWDSLGNAIAEGRAQISLNAVGNDGWEQDANEFEAATETAVKEVLSKIDAKNVRAVCITHQRETFVLTDEQGTPIHPALVWMDARCRQEVRDVTTKLDASVIHQISGKFPCTTPSMYKLAYLLERGAPQLKQAPFRFLDVGGFLIKKLTNEFRTSIASADPMGLVDMQKRDWSDELLKIMGLQRNQLAQLYEPGQTLGYVTRDAQDRYGLLEGTPIVAGAGDGQSAALGAGLSSHGAAYLNLGTAIVSGVVSNEYKTDLAFRTMMAAQPSMYLYETDLKGGTFTLSWFVEKLLGQSDIKTTLTKLSQEAESIAPGSHGLMVLPYFHGVMNPYWDDNATGLFFGLNGAQGAAHFYRAILEGIAFEQRLHTEGVEKASQPIHEFIVMGGGATSDLFCTILASVLNKPIVRAGTTEATSLGAGILAAAGTGAFADVHSAAKAMTRRGEVILPLTNGDVEKYDRLYQRVYKTLYPALTESMRALAALKAAL